MESYSKKRARLIKEKAFDKFGNCCNHCGFTDPRALQIDHVNGDGSTDLDSKGRRFRGINLHYKILYDNENRYQLLCANCNVIKRIENNETPLTSWQDRWGEEYTPKKLATKNQQVMVRRLKI